ncbi:DNA internalization-related competence protein ComEC/Rec2 [Bombilactobacillus folatiphilus]|uniref:DNA internalization-related competence protein ComEC/Rec2 n=1 Tax=Bombilactobacillus folatiphilus TaxID=2923362 RepID=A0ABY4PAP6_9LACO|nr:DNA internalization-related competence protein ComEC/Rec2 [Bombilactobacillus folatiphilus]UQS82742.1 DNA internalization-related competence protein ComEC/Rec2 [Bombilactobacillus folatiphilus]
MFERGWFLFGALALQLMIAFKVTHNWLWLSLFGLLILVIFRNRHYQTLFLILIAGFVGTLLVRSPDIKEPTVRMITVYPDQITQKNDWTYGQGRLPTGQRVSFGFSSKKHFLQSKILYLQADFEWQRVAPATNPGEFDFQKYYQTKQIYFRANATQVRVQTRSPHSILELLHVWRFQLLQKLQSLPRWLKLNASSLLFGQFDNQEQDLRQGLTNIGIIHIFSISGLHISLLVGWVLRISSLIRLRKERVEWAVIGTLPIVAIITGSGVGVWRACVGRTLQILNDKGGWLLSRNDLFALTLTIHSLFDPYVLFSLAGQLSYLLAYGLIILNQSNLLQQSLLINLISAPVLIFHNYSFGWLTFLANLCLTPLFEKFIIPVTIFSVFCSSNYWLITNLELFFDIIYRPIELTAHASWTQLTVGQMSLMFLILLLCLTLMVVQHPTKKNLLGLLSIYCFLILNNHFPVNGEVSLIDIGQGDSILITTPFLQHTFLIDTGGKLNFGKYHSTNNRVQSITIPYLRYKGITHLDGVFLTHQDADHIGDLSVLLQNFPVHNVYFADGMQNNKAVQRQLQNFQTKITLTKLHVNDQFNLGHHNSIKVVWPDHLSNSKNEDSLSLLCHLQNKTWLFTGDLDRQNELKLFKNHTQHVDYLKAGHHGSKTASSPKFLRQIQPEKVLISVGRHNRYGHPSSETMSTLKKLRIPTLSTAQHGMITWQYNYHNQQNWQVFSRKKLDESQ